MTNTNTSFGKRIKELRIAKKLTQEQMADLTGVKRATINSIERDGQRPTIDFLLMFSKAVGMGLDAILGLDLPVDNGQISEILNQSDSAMGSTEIAAIKTYIAKIEAEKAKLENDYQTLTEKHEKLIASIQLLKQKFSDIIE